VADVTASHQLPVALRSYMHQSTDGRAYMTDAHNSHLARAFGVWNSKVGVPLDVWAILETASVYCTACARCRSFDGDRQHRADCKSAVPSKYKGKERMLDTDCSCENTGNGLEMVLYRRTV
jgi:hypothetical protein